MKEELTQNQARFMTAIANLPKKTTEILNELYYAYPGYYYSWDQIHSGMRRLEDRGLVRRAEERPIKWELTAKGRKALDG